MSNILVIPDCHCRKFWRKYIEEYSDKVDKVIFLGDYLDPYPEEIEMNPELMECKDFYDSESLLNMLNDIVSLKKSDPEKYILLTGNHSDSYIWSEFSAATRTDKMNWKKYHNFFLENLDLFNLAWIENNVIFSHAGITKNWAYEFLANYMEYCESALEGNLVLEAATVLKDTPLKDFNSHYINALSMISGYRGGLDSCGSCEWADINEHFLPITYDNYQVFGHTQLRAPLMCDKWACLDCRKGFIIDTNTNKIEDV